MRGFQECANAWRASFVGTDELGAECLSWFVKALLKRTTAFILVHQPQPHKVQTNVNQDLVQPETFDAALLAPGVISSKVVMATGSGGNVEGFGQPGASDEVLLGPDVVSSKVVLSTDSGGDNALGSTLVPCRGTFPPMPGDAASPGVGAPETGALEVFGQRHPAARGPHRAAPGPKTRAQLPAARRIREVSGTDYDGWRRFADSLDISSSEDLAARGCGGHDVKGRVVNGGSDSSCTDDEGGLCIFCGTPSSCGPCFECNQAEMWNEPIGRRM